MQPEKALLPIEVTELPISTEVRPMQPEKALLPNEVTELGISTDNNDLHSSNAPLGITDTVFGMTTFFTLLDWNAQEAISVAVNVLPMKTGLATMLTISIFW